MALAVAVLTTFLFLLFLPVSVQLEILAAGVPRPQGETRDYDAIFGNLTASGVSAFFPLFQYQEIPTSESLGFEVDFVPPCSSLGFEPLVRQGMKLLLSANLLYPIGAPFPTLAEDPVATMLQCIPRENIMAFYNYDEPAHQSKDVSLYLAQTELVYNRVKEIDATIPVWIIQAPIFSVIDYNATFSSPVTTQEVNEYFETVKLFLPFADVHGFDLYAIPSEYASLASPYSNQTLDYMTVFHDYYRWMDDNIFPKEYVMILQGCSFRELFGIDSDLLRYPTRQELDNMLDMAIESDVSYVGWYCQSFMDSQEGDAFWDTVLSASLAAIQRAPTSTVQTSPSTITADPSTEEPDSSPSGTTMVFTWAFVVLFFLLDVPPLL